MTKLAQYTVQPLTVGQAKTHLIVEHNDDDALISNLISAAADWVFQHCGGVVGEVVATQYFDRFAQVMRLKGRDATTIESINYIEAESIEYAGTVNTDQVRLTEGRIFEPLAGWPETSQTDSCVRITYNLSGDSSSLKQAMLLLIGYWYQNREDAPLSSNVHRAVNSLLNSYRQYA